MLSEAETSSSTCSGSCIYNTYCSYMSIRMQLSCLGGNKGHWVNGAHLLFQLINNKSNIIFKKKTTSRIALCFYCFPHRTFEYMALTMAIIAAAHQVPIALVQSRNTQHASIKLIVIKTQMFKKFLMTLSF